jgi:hypothetical protein
MKTILAGAIVVVGIGGFCQAFINPGVEILRGDANGDHQVNSSDSLYISNFLFSSGPAPSCLDAADVNEDGRIDLSDVIYLNAYLYQGGPAPAAPFPSCGYPPSTDVLSCNHPTCP